MSITCIRENIYPAMPLGFGWPHGQGRDTDNRPLSPFRNIYANPVYKSNIWY